MSLKLLRVCTFKPDNCISNEYFKERMQIDSDWIVKRSGIKTRFHSDIPASEMALTVGRKLDLSRDEIEKIRLVIASTVTPDIRIPSFSALLQKELQLSEDCFCVDINTACSGHVSAVILAERILRNGDNALVVSSERLSEIINWEDKKSCVLFGDAAAAVLYRKSDGNFHSIARTYGNNEDLFLEKNGVLHMDGRNVFRFALDKVPRAVNAMFESADISLDDIDHVIFHQANIRIIQTVADTLGVLDKVSTNIENYGNTSSASVPLLMSEMLADGKIKTGQKLLLIGFGGGLSISAAVIES